jgi:hypothetical protein
MTNDRRRYQRTVERLLEEIRGRVAELERIRAHGVRPAALEEKKLELRRTRDELAAVIAAHAH